MLPGFAAYSAHAFQSSILYCGISHPFSSSRKKITVNFIDVQVALIIIQWSFCLPFHWPRATTWPANNCLQIMVCSCVVPSKRVFLQIIFYARVIETTFSRKKGRSLPWAARKWLKYENKLGDRVIKQLLNSVIPKYRDLSVSRQSIICLSLRQIIDQLATDKWRYFAQARPIIVNCCCWDVK